MAHNDPWLEGIKAAEDKKPRLNPYDNGEGNPNHAYNWYAGYDTAKIVIDDLATKQFKQDH